MNTLQACAANKKDIPAYMFSIARLCEPAEEYFPIGFLPDYAAVVVDLFVRDILSVSLRTKGEFHVYIKLKDYTLSNIPWLPFTLALHAITQSTKCCVFFEGIAPDEYSKIVDSYRPYSPLNCLKNLVAYLCTPKGDRPKRVFEQLSNGLYISFEERIMGLYQDPSSFERRYLKWIVNPYKTYNNWSPYVYFTHPFDHLPVRNLTRGLKNIYLSRTEMKKIGISNPDINKAVLMHDQIQTVVLRPYWYID